MDRLPAHETAPIILSRRPDLVRESEAIGPSLLLGTPATVPHEFVHQRLGSGLDADGPDEIGAAGAAAERDAFDRQMRLGGQHLGEESPHFDPGREAFDPDAVGAARREVAANRALEGVGRIRSRKQLFELSQATLGWLGRQVAWGSRNIANDTSKLKWLAIFSRETSVAMLKAALDSFDPTS